MKKSIRTLVILLTAVLLVCCATPLTASAKSSNGSFTYDLQYHSVAAPDAAEFYQNITGEGLSIGMFSEPTDVCNDADGNVYIVDKGNNRIVITDRYGRFVSVITAFENNGKEDSFRQPEGITVTESGDIYICDTGNSRIVQLHSDHSLNRVIKAPESAALGNDFIFTPVRIAVDGLERIYVVSRNFNSGIIELKQSGEFNEIYGSIQVAYKLTDILWRMISTKSQRERSVSLIPNEYSSVCVNAKNFVYACSAFYDSIASSSGSVKKLNALGDNVLEGVPNETVNLYTKGTYGGPETYVDICDMGNDIYALLDNTRGRVYVYNNDGDMLFEFGGKGTYNSTFGTVSALSYRNGYFYVVDSRNDFVSILTLTDYAKSYLEAAEYHSIGDYESENEIWKEIYRLNNNSICAIRNFGKVNYREGNYAAAMEYFKLANDRDSYSEAYAKQRKIFVNDHFSMIFIGAIIIAVAAVTLFVFAKKHRRELADKHSYRATLQYSTKVIFRPMSGFWDMKHERYGSVAAASTVLVAVMVFFAFFNSLKGFIFTSGTEQANFMMGLLTVLAPFFLFIVCNWCVSNLMDGEGSFKYIFMGTAYALTPMIFMLPVLLLLSNVMTADESGIYSLIFGIMLLWVGYLIVCSNMEIHSYTMGKTVLVLLITLLVMVVVVFLVMLVFALGQKILGVATDMYNELYLRF